MAFTNAWDESSPADTQLAKLGAQDMRTIELNVRERMSAFGAGTLANRPTPEAVFAGVIYIATDALRIYQWSGTAWVDITAVFTGAGSDSVKVNNVSSPTSIASGGFGGALTFNLVEYDANSLFSSPSLFIIKTAGKYLVTAYLTYIDNTIGTSRKATITHGGVAVVAGHQVNPSAAAGNMELSLSGVDDFLVGHNISLGFSHDMGVNVSVTGYFAAQLLSA